MVASYGTIPSGFTRRSMQRGSILAALFGVGVVALFAVVYVSSSARSTEMLTKVSTDDATKDLNSYFDKVNKNIKKSSRELPYKSSNEARDDLNSYFDKKFSTRPKDYLSAEKSIKELDYIFPTKISKTKGSKAMKVTKGQVLAFSRGEAQEDLNDYFDTLDTSTHSHAWSDMDSSSKKYIENKRKALHDSRGGFTQVDKNGNSIEVKKVWTAANAAADLDSYYGGKPAAPVVNAAAPSPAPSDELLRAAKAKKLHEAIQKDPQLKKKLDQVHEQWMKEHGSVPKNAAEKAEYKKLMAGVVGQLDLTLTKADLQSAAAAPAAQAAPASSSNAAPTGKIDVSTQYQVFNAYLDMHPHIAAKYDKFKRVWRRDHSKDLPTNAQEAKEYNELMVKYVGKLKINAEDVTNQWNALWDARHGHKNKAAAAAGSSSLSSKPAAAPKSGGEAADALKVRLARDQSLKAKLDKVHAEWAAVHGSRLPETHVEREQYRSLLQKAGVVSHKASMVSLAQKKKAHTPEEIAMAKQRALMDLEKHQKDIARKIKKVHEEWKRHHTAPPQNALEEKEYDKLLAKYVGHPDVSNQYTNGDKPASKLSAAPAPASDEDKMLDLDASLLN